MFFSFFLSRFGSNSPPGEAVERESSLGGGANEYTIAGTPQLSTGGSSTRMILHNTNSDAPSYIDPPSFEETVMKARSRSQSAASASYAMENNPGTDWDNEEETKLDFPIGGMPNNDYVFDDSDNSIEKNPVESVLSEETDRFSDHTQYSHLAAINPLSSPAPTTILDQRGNTSIFHHQLNLPMSANSTDSRGTPTSFSEMVQNRLSAQSEDENTALNYATYV